MDMLETSTLVLAATKMISERIRVGLGDLAAGDADGTAGRLQHSGWAWADGKSSWPSG